MVGGCQWLSFALGPVGNERIASKTDRVTGPGNPVDLPPTENREYPIETTLEYSKIR